jgi:hypothetical protein
MAKSSEWLLFLLKEFASRRVFSARPSHDHLRAILNL